MTPHQQARLDAARQELHRHAATMHHAAGRGHRASARLHHRLTGNSHHLRSRRGGGHQHHGSVSTTASVLASAAHPAAPAPGGGAATGSVAAIAAAADRLNAMHLRYVMGGGHQGGAAQTAGGLDCSGAVSWVLQHAGIGMPTLDSRGFTGWGAPGPGGVTIHARNGHVLMSINGRFFGTGQGGGAHWLPTPSASYLSRFTVRHVPGT